MSALKSSTLPTDCQGWSLDSKIGPSAKPSAGSTIAAVATAPAVWAVPTMKRRRVTVSPSKPPGIWRSTVVFGFAGLRSGTGIRVVRRTVARRNPHSIEHRL